MLTIITCRGRPLLCALSASSSTPVASIGSSGSPRVRANTLVEPPGSAASAVSRAGQPVGRLVERAVTAEHDDDVDAVGGRALGEARGVAPAARLGDRDVVVGRQRLGDHDPPPGGHRRGERVDDEQEPHMSGDAYQGRRLLWSLSAPTLASR